MDAVIFTPIQYAGLTNAGAPSGLSQTSRGLEQIAIAAIFFFLT